VNLGDVTVDAIAPTGSIAFVDGDDGLLNLADITAVALSGSIEAGLDSSNVVITITDSAEGEVTVDTSAITVGTDGALSVTGLDLSALTAGALSVAMTVTDAAGNTATATGATESDLTAPVDITIDFVDGADGLLNADDITAVDLSGSIEAGLDNSNVVITITDSAEGEVTVDTSAITVGTDGALSVTGLDLSALTAGVLSVSMIVTDAAGNTATATGATESDLTAPNITDNTIEVVNAVDGAVSAAGSTGLELAGTVEAGLDVDNIDIVITDSEDNSITVSDDDIVIDDTVLTVESQDISELADGDIDVTVTVTDDAGNSIDISVEITKLASDFLKFDENTSLTVSEAGIAAATTEATDSLVFTDTSSTAVLSLSSTESLTSNDQALVWVVTDEGRTLTLASDADNAAATAVMVVSVTEDGSEVVYSAELLGNIDQNEADSTTVDVLVTLTDGDVSTSSTLEIDITDDTPKIAVSTVVETLSSGTDYTGNIFDGDESLGYGFGADSANGQVQSFTLQGLTFTVSDDGTYADVTGTSDVFDLSAGDTVTIVEGILAVETDVGESFSIDINTGDYTYSHDGQFGAADEANTRPDVTIAETGDVLGIVGINVLDIIDLNEDQLFNAYDNEENLSSVTISTVDLLTVIGSIPLLNGIISTVVGDTSWSWSSELAAELGLEVEPSTGIDDDLILNITSLDGSDITNIEINEFLASVTLDIEPTGLLSDLVNNVLNPFDLDTLLLNILSSTTISATDSLGATSSSDSDSSVVNLDLLADDYIAPVDEGTTGNDTVTATQSGSNVYGYAGDDTLTGGSDSNILRGGSGDDILDGAASSDILIGGSGDDSLAGGTGEDVIRWEAGDEGTVAAPAKDTVLDFNNDDDADVTDGDILDLTDLLDGAYYVSSTSNNLANYVTFEYVAANGDTEAYTTIHISTTGDLNLASDGYEADQTIKLEGVDITSSGTLTDSDIIDTLIADNQLLIGTEVNETDISVTVVDGDGDTATGEITFVGEESLDAVTNTAPIVTLQDSELLGLVGLEALDLIDLSNNKVFVADPDNNLREVVINYAAVVDVSALSGLLSDPQFTWDNDLATSLGLSVTSSKGGIIGTLATSAELTITATDGGDIDNLALNQFLATIGFDDGGAAEFNLANIDLLDAYSITATDAYDASTTDAISSLAGVELLDSNDPLFSGIDESNTFIGSLLTDDEIDISANLEGSAIFGLSGNDSLIGGLGNDVIRGGEGDDSLVGNAGDDLLIGDSGSNTFDGGAGDDLIVTSSLDFTIEGGADIDTVSFDGTGKGIDLVALSAQAEPSVMTNIEVLDISASSETGTSLKIDADTVLNLTDGDNELYIDGDEGDSVEAAGATSSATTTEFNGTTYDTYQLGEATLYIDQDVTVNTSNG